MRLPTDQKWPWIVDLVLVLYLLWNTYVLSTRVHTFRSLFSSLNAEVPIATTIAITLCTPPTPVIILLLLLAALVVKNRFLATPTAKLGSSLLVLIAATFWGSLVHEALFLPFRDLVSKLG